MYAELGLPIDLGIDVDDVQYLTEPPPSEVGLSISAFSGLRRRSAIFAVRSDGLVLATTLADGRTATTRAAVSVATLASGLTAEVASVPFHSTLSAVTMGLCRDLAMSGLTVGGTLDVEERFGSLEEPSRSRLRALVDEVLALEGLQGPCDSLKVARLAPVWHLLSGDALVLRTHFRPPLDRFTDLRALQLLLVGPPGRRAVVVPDVDGSVHLSTEQRLISTFVEALRGIADAAVSGVVVSAE